MRRRVLRGVFADGKRSGGGDKFAERNSGQGKGKRSEKATAGSSDVHDRRRDRGTERGLEKHFEQQLLFHWPPLQ